MSIKSLHKELALLACLCALFAGLFWRVGIIESEVVLIACTVSGIYSFFSVYGSRIHTVFFSIMGILTVVLGLMAKEDVIPIDALYAVGIGVAGFSGSLALTLIIEKKISAVLKIIALACSLVSIPLALLQPEVFALDMKTWALFGTVSVGFSIAWPSIPRDYVVLRIKLWTAFPSCCFAAALVGVTLTPLLEINVIVIAATIISILSSAVLCFSLFRRQS